jgi:hypothetical protein
LPCRLGRCHWTPPNDIEPSTMRPALA